MVICIITVVASSTLSVLNMTFRFTDGLNPQVVMENNPQARHVPPSIWSHIVQPLHFSLDAMFFCCLAMTRSPGAMVLRSTNTPHKFSYLDVHYKQDGKLPPR